MKKIEIYSIFNHNPDFIYLQYESIVRNILDQEYEYIVVNNARNPGIRHQIESLRHKEKNLLSLLMKSIQTILRKHKINRIGRKLGIRVIQVKEVNLTDNNSRFPSRIVAYTLNWLFRYEIKPAYTRNIVCLLDSDMFFISKISLEEVLDGRPAGIIPQYRGTDVRYLWTGFAIFDFGALSNPDKLDFSLGFVNDQRCDVGGMTHHYLNTYCPTFTEYEFINLVNAYKTKDGIKVKAHISGNAGLDVEFDNNDKISSLQVSDSHNQINSVLGSDSSQIIMNYERSLSAAVKFCKGLNLDPKNIDLIFRKHKFDNDFFVLHYKNGSNPRNFEDRKYSKSKLEWCKSIVLNEELGEND